MKVGDKVRILHTDYPECGLDVGSVHEVQIDDSDIVFLKADDGANLAFYTHEVQPLTAHTIQLNQTYTSKNGTKWECIAIKDGIAFLSSGGEGDAYRFLLNGENLSQGGGMWDIEWEPVIEWVTVQGGFTTGSLENATVHPLYADHKFKLTVAFIDGEPDFTQATVTPV